MMEAMALLLAAVVVVAAAQAPAPLKHRPLAVVVPSPPVLLGNCTCSAASRRRYLGEFFVVLPTTTGTQQVVLAFHPSDGVLLEARSVDAGTSWTGWTAVPGTGKWVGSGPRCAVVEFPPAAAGNNVKLVCTVSVYPTGVSARTATWDGSKLMWNNDTKSIWSGKDGGGIRHTIVLYSGRVLCMVQAQTGPHKGFPASVITLYSDHPYTSWHQSNPVGCSATPGACYGAVEPVAVEQSNGSLLTMMRTQTGVLWQTTSADAGATLAPATATALASSDSPPFLLRLTHGRTALYGRNSSAILLLWVNVRTTAPLVCMHNKAFHGSGVYAVRHVLHGAVSLDDGATFQGAREVYRDPLMSAQPPHEGDIGVAYSYGTELGDGKVLFATGQGVGRTQLIRLDPSWLLEPTTKTADFSSALAKSTWNQPTAIASPDYVSTCMYYRCFGACGAPRNCSRGHDGTALKQIQQSDGGKPATTQALCMTLTGVAESAAAIWNFPSQSKGTVTAVVQPGPGQHTLNASWALADAMFPPWDAEEERASVFAGAVPQLPSSVWSTLSFTYDLAGECTVAVNGIVAVSSPIPIGRRENEGAVSYLAFRSLGPESTLCIKSLSSTSKTDNKVQALLLKTDDSAAPGTESFFKVTVGWDEPPLAVSPAINAWHDTPLGASGNPNHDDVYPPSTYDIVESMDSARSQLRAPYVRLWSDTSYVYDWPTGGDAAGAAKAAHPSCPRFTVHGRSDIPAGPDSNSKDLCEFATTDNETAVACATACCSMATCTRFVFAAPGLVPGPVSPPCQHLQSNCRLPTAPDSKSYGCCYLKAGSPPVIPGQYEAGVIESLPLKPPRRTVVGPAALPPNNTQTCELHFPNCSCCPKADCGCTGGRIANTTSWDFRALDIQVQHFLGSVAFPETSILQLTGNSPPWWFWAPGADHRDFAEPTGVREGNYFSKVLDWYQKGGFTDELGVYHHSGHNFSWGFLEVLNEMDYIAGPKYIRWYDGVTKIVKANHPDIKFIGNCHAGQGAGDNASTWRQFLNRSAHAPGTPWPIDA